MVQAPRKQNKTTFYILHTLHTRTHAAARSSVFGPRSSRWSRSVGVVVLRSSLTLEPSNPIRGQWRHQDSTDGASGGVPNTVTETRLHKHVFEVATSFLVPRAQDTYRTQHRPPPFPNQPCVHVFKFLELPQLSFHGIGVVLLAQRYVPSPGPQTYMDIALTKPTS